jgi:hypothetical protein
MDSGYHIVTIRVIGTSWAHVWRLRSLFLRTGYDKKEAQNLTAKVAKTHGGGTPARTVMPGPLA